MVKNILLPLLLILYISCKKETKILDNENLNKSVFKKKFTGTK
jgi:hypothetical protein